VKDVVAAHYRLALVPLIERAAPSREGRRHAVVREVPHPSLGGVEDVLAVEHRREVASEPLRHAAALRLRRRIERSRHQPSKLDGVVAVLRRNVEQDGQGRTMDKPRGYSLLPKGDALLPHELVAADSVVAREHVEAVQAGQREAKPFDMLPHEFGKIALRLHHPGNIGCHIARPLLIGRHGVRSERAMLAVSIV
jgi:hypothetical protein